MATITGKEIYYDDDRVISGKYLDYHAASEYSEAKINERQWDYVLLQGAGPNLAYPNAYPDHPVLPALQQLEEKIHGNCATTKIVYMMPWAFEDGMTWVAGWTDDFFDMQQIIYTKTLEMAEVVDIIIAPVGWAYNSIMDDGCPFHYLFATDYNHPSLRGSYLITSVLYSTVFEESTEGINYYAGVSQAEAEYFQTVASTTVLENMELWKIITSIDQYENETPKSIDLFQNYPNPFNGYTNIVFELSRSEDVRLSVYDSLARKVATLVDDNLDGGLHTVSFNADNLSSGTYFYVLKVGNTAISKPMVLLK